MKLIIALAQEDTWETEPFIIGVYTSIEKAREHIKAEVERLSQIPYINRDSGIAAIIPQNLDYKTGKTTYYKYIWKCDDNDGMRIGCANNHPHPYDITFEEWEVTL